MNADGNAVPTPLPDHELRTSGRGAFYSFSFDLGPNLDLVKLANKLLKKNMATVAASPSRDGLRVGNRLVETDRHHRQSEKFGEWLDIMYSDDVNWRKLFHLNWKLTLRILWLVRKIVGPALLHRILWGQWVTRIPRDERVVHSEISEGMPEGIRESRDQVGTAVKGMADVLWDQHALGALRLRLEPDVFAALLHAHRAVYPHGNESSVFYGCQS
jgi:hypothetical protein